MMRSLWTGASGMTAQQLSMDAISNNIANVNTHGYKKERVEFQSMLYQTLDKSTVSADTGIAKPTNLQIGHGVKPVAVTRVFDQGSLQVTNNSLDFALDGPGFFAVQVDGDTKYTKSGSLKLSPLEDNTLVLVTSDGYPVLSTEDEIITIENNTNFTVDQEGVFWGQSAEGTFPLGFQLKIVQFTNPQGLMAEGGDYFNETAASGVAIVEAEEEDLQERTNVNQGFLEMSNVNIADEMVGMIVAQRAYELNSKTITTSDEMLQQANNLKR